MQKVKFQIEGMNCQSCVRVIEETLKSKEGILEAKLNIDSKKAVVVFDEQKIKESEIQNAIEKSGHYKAKKFSEDEKGKKEIEENKGRFENNQLTMNEQFSNKVYFWLGFLIAFSVFSLVLNVILLKPFLTVKNLGVSGGTIVRNENPTLPTNPPSKDNTQPTIQNFEITTKDHVKGDFNAPITLVEFSDFECPFCERHYPTLNRILNEYKGKVRLVYKHFPLSSIHPNAQKAAEASECAAEQGKFWEYHDKLFENQRSGFSVEKFKQWAKELGLDTTKFNDCLDSGKYAQKVKDDYQEGLQKGVSGTPSVFVNGELIVGAVPYEVLKQKIDSLLTK
jgi:protein-disulfide isomerase/copper chaperone CopZ